MAAANAMRASSRGRRARLGLTLAALGVVFGDIGTSPLYTLQTCLQIVGNGKPAAGDVVGVLSLLIWALLWVVCLKYIVFVMRVDHDGEGGILALLALAAGRPKVGGVVAAGALTTIVVVGAGMLFGDGLITPAISVISAIEGIGVVSNALTSWIVPLSVLILVALFAVQSRGTERVGRLFGPVMVLWFIALAIGGAIGIAAEPSTLAAIDPRHGLAFLVRHGPLGIAILGGVVLAVTGVEALYADMSHFGRPPIVRAWFALVFPALLLNYLGQGAHLLRDPAAIANPFYALYPGWQTLLMVVLATAATVIASQALISGAFTLIEQAIALGLAPRTEVRHTSQRERGQVFVPVVDWLLGIGCITLVLTFRSSARLAAAYGLAVAVTMLCTTVAYYVVVTRVRGWNRAGALALGAAFALVDGAFVVGGLPKFIDGGWLPVAISAAFTVVALTWLRGRRAVAHALAQQQTPIERVLHKFRDKDGPASGTMVFLTPDPSGIPFLAGHQWIRDRAEEERIVLLHLRRATTPYVQSEERVRVERLHPRLIRVVAAFGYMEPPRIEPILRACGTFGLDLDREDTSFFYADPKLETAEGGLGPWQRWLFTTLQHNSRPLPDDLGIIAERRIELGLTVRI